MNHVLILAFKSKSNQKCIPLPSKVDNPPKFISLSCICLSRFTPYVSMHTYEAGFGNICYNMLDVLIAALFV